GDTDGDGQAGANGDVAVLDKAGGGGGQPLVGGQDDLGEPRARGTTVRGEPDPDLVPAAGCPFHDPERQVVGQLVGEDHADGRAGGQVGQGGRHRAGARGRIRSASRVARSDPPATAPI